MHYINGQPFTGRHHAADFAETDAIIGFMQSNPIVDIRANMPTTPSPQEPTPTMADSVDGELIVQDWPADDSDYSDISDDENGDGFESTWEVFYNADGGNEVRLVGVRGVPAGELAGVRLEEFVGLGVVVGGMSSDGDTAAAEDGVAADIASATAPTTNTKHHRASDVEIITLVDPESDMPEEPRTWLHALKSWCSWLGVPTAMSTASASAVMLVPRLD